MYFSIFESISLKDPDTEALFVDCVGATASLGLHSWSHQLLMICDLRGSEQTQRIR